MDQFKPFNDQKEYEQNVKPHEVKYVEEVQFKSDVRVLGIVEVDKGQPCLITE